MRSYNFGFRKWFIPAIIKTIPIRYWCQGNIDIFLGFKSNPFEVFSKLEFPKNKKPPYVSIGRLSLN
jgi:hypothetical protein